MGCVHGPLRFLGVSFHAPWYPFISALPPWGLFKDDITRDSSRGHSRILWHLLGDPPDVSWDRLKNSHPWPLKTLARNSFGILHLYTGISLGVVSMSVGILSWFLDSDGFFQGVLLGILPGLQRSSLCLQGSIQGPLSSGRCFFRDPSPVFWDNYWIPIGPHGWMLLGILPGSPGIVFHVFRDLSRAPWNF